MIASKPIQTDESVLSGYEIAVILPAWNEGDHIEAVLASMPGFVRHVIVVDDASSDNTAGRVLECAEIDSRIVLVRHERNQGVGAGKSSGWRRMVKASKASFSTITACPTSQ